MLKLAPNAMNWTGVRPAARIFIKHTLIQCNWAIDGLDDLQQGYPGWGTTQLDAAFYAAAGGNDADLGKPAERFTEKGKGDGPALSNLFGGESIL
jgi:hypothetical protein